MILAAHFDMYVCVQLLARLALKKGVNLDLDNFITPKRKFEFEIVSAFVGPKLIPVVLDTDTRRC